MKSKRKSGTGKKNSGRRLPAKRKQPRRRTQKAQRIYSSFDEVLAHRIAAGKTSMKAAEDSILFASILSSISPSMRRASYKSGMRVGRIVYALGNTPGQKSSWHQEALVGIASFFQNCGYRNTTFYNVGPSSIIEIKRDGPYVGADIHEFESGIISGFLSAANGHLISVSEERCANNGYQSCRFISENKNAQKREGAPKMLGRFAEHLASATINIAGREPRYGLADEYQVLAMSHHMHRDLLEPSSYIALMAGAFIGTNLFKHYREIPLKGNADALGAAARAIRSLNLGSPNVIMSEPFGIRVRFSTSNSKREFVEIANAAISGILSEYPGAEFGSRESVVKGLYMLEFRRVRK